MSDAFIPQLAGYYLNISVTSDTFPYALSINEYPFSTTNSIQNLGQKTRKIAVECAFFDNTPITEGWDPKIKFPTYDNHISFLEKIESSLLPLTFTHPKYGEIEGYIEQITVNADDTQRYAEIIFDFVEEVIIKGVRFKEQPVLKQAESVQKVTKSVSDDLDADSKLTKNLKAWEASMATFRSKLDAWVDKVTTQPTSIVNTINYADNVVGLTTESIGLAIDRVVQSYILSIPTALTESGVSNYLYMRNRPAQFINNLIVGCRALKANFTGIEAKYVHVMAASRISYEAAISYDDDEEKNTETLRNENIRTFDEAGNYVGSSTYEETMTINELENSLYALRSFIDEAIQLDRSKRDLLNQAKSIQDYVNKIKLNRQGLETRENVPLQSLHTLATQNNLSYQATERILRLNPSIKNPTFIDGEIKILV